MCLKGEIHLKLQLIPVGSLEEETKALPGAYFDATENNKVTLYQVLKLNRLAVPIIFIPIKGIVGC